MARRKAIVGFLGAVLLAGACREPISPENNPGPAPSSLTPAFAVLAPGSSRITLNQVNGSLYYSDATFIRKGFNPTNPHRGDAIVATFYWVGGPGTNIITSVTDMLTDANFTPVGNTYTLVDFVSSGGISMATYVATNAQNFPDPNSPAQNDILAVQATFSQPITDGGVTLSSWSGVNSVAAYSLGAHGASSGAAAGVMTVGPGPLSIGDGAMTYAVTASNVLVGRDAPAGFSNVSAQSDGIIVAESDYQLHSGVGTINPQWTWYFPDAAQGGYVTTALVMNPPLHLGFAVQPVTTLPMLAIPAVQVQVLDALGNRVTSFNGTVTVAIGHNGGTVLPGTLSGTKTVTVVNGVATFSDLSIDQPGSGYTLVASPSDGFTVESAPFNIGAF